MVNTRLCDSVSLETLGSSLENVTQHPLGYKPAEKWQQFPYIRQYYELPEDAQTAEHKEKAKATMGLALKYVGPKYRVVTWRIVVPLDSSIPKMEIKLRKSITNFITDQWFWTYYSKSVTCKDPNFKHPEIIKDTIWPQNEELLC